MDMCFQFSIDIVLTDSLDCFSPYEKYYRGNKSASAYVMILSWAEIKPWSFLHILLVSKMSSGTFVTKDMKDKWTLNSCVVQ